MKTSIVETYNCFYGGHGKVSMIMGCSHKHLVSKAQLERKHLTLEGKQNKTKDSGNILFASI